MITLCLKQWLMFADEELCQTLCYIMVISAQLLHTRAVASQSILQPSTYFPGLMLWGILTVSTTATAPQGDGWLPEQIPGWDPSLQGGSKLGSGVLSQVVQSLPGVPGHGVHPAPDLHPPPRHLGGMGFMAHMDPSGSTPSVTKVPLIGSLVPLFHCKACMEGSNSRGCFIKHSSVSSSVAGQRRY